MAVRVLERFVSWYRLNQPAADKAEVMTTDVARQNLDYLLHTLVENVKEMSGS